jgi:hypothetical protein
MVDQVKQPLPKDTKSLCEHLKANMLADNGETITWLHGEDERRKIRLLIELLNGAAKIYAQKGVDPREVVGLRNELASALNGGNSSATRRDINASLALHLRRLQSMIEQQKKMQLIGKGVETDVYSLPIFSSAGFVYKRLYETFDPGIIEKHRRNLEVYSNRLNNVSPYFANWPIELKVIQRRVQDKTKYIVYGKQPRFEKEAKLKYHLHHDPLEMISETMRCLVYVILKLMVDNRTMDTSVTFDCNGSNVIYARGRLYYIDNHNPLLLYKRDDGSFEALVDLIMKEKRARDYLIRPINRYIFKRQRGQWLDLAFIVGKMINVFHFSSGRRISKGLIYKTVADVASSLDMPEADRKTVLGMKVGWFRHYVINGEIFSGIIQSEA